MTRSAAFALLLAMIALALLNIALLEAKAANAGLPLVNAAEPDPQPHMLFAPCPVAPRNFPRWQERKA